MNKKLTAPISAQIVLFSSFYNSNYFKKPFMFDNY